MKKLLCRIFAVLILVGIMGVMTFLLATSTPIDTTTTEEITATVTDATSTDIATATEATPTDLATAMTPTAEEITEEITTEECIEIPSSEDILSHREEYGVDETYKISNSRTNTYNIIKQDEAYYVKNFHNTVTWYAPIVDSDMFAAGYVNIYNVPNIESTNFESLSKGTAVKLVGVSQNGWDIILYNEKLYFIWYENLIDYQIIDYVEPVYQEEIVAEEVYYEPEPAPEYEDNSDAPIAGSNFKYNGREYSDGYTWTYYSQRVLPGEGLDIPGRYVDESGYVCDEDGNICVASRDLPKGTVIDTPFGKQGVVYDYCPRSGVIDVYTDW